MVIFNCSAKHSAVSAGQVRRVNVNEKGGRIGEEDGLLTSLCPLGCQFDFAAWMPNLPPSMQLPPPTSKGQARLEGFLATLPPVNATCDVVIALWLLSKEPGDRVSVGLGTWLGQPWGKGGDAVYPS